MENQNIPKKEVEITYIRNKKKETKKIPQERIWNTQTTYSYENLDILSIPADIEILYIKGLYWLRELNFNCQNKETKLVLEDCAFKEDVLFNSKNVSVIQPTSLKNPIEKELSLCFFDTENVEIHCKEQKQESARIECAVTNGRKVSISGNASNIILRSLITGEGPLSVLEIRNAKNMTIPSFPWIIAKNILIKSSQNIFFQGRQTFERLEIINSMIIDPSGTIRKIEKITLENQEKMGSFLPDFYQKILFMKK